MMGKVAYSGRIAVLSLTQNQFTLPTGHFGRCTQALIIVPTNEYAAESDLLQKVPKTDITLVLDQYDNLILFHRVWYGYQCC